MPSSESADATQQHDDQRLLTVREVSQRLRVSDMTVYRLIHAGTLPAFRVGRSFRVSTREFAEYIARTQQRPIIPIPAADTDAELRDKAPRPGG